MNGAACLPMPTGPLVRASLPRTPAASNEGKRAVIYWVESVKALREPQYVVAGERPLEDQLAEALSAAQDAIQQQSRYISAEDRNAINSSLADLLSVENWDDDDEILRVSSVQTMLRLLIALENGLGDFSISRSGNLVSTWSVADHVLRVEALTNGAVTWTVLHPRGSAPRHEHSASDTIENLKGLLQQIAG